jgi:hypothetical protein
MGKDLMMDADVALVTPELDDIPEDDSAEPEDASIDHNLDTPDHDGPVKEGEA